MKKSLRASTALTGLVLAAGLVFSGCLAISDADSDDSETTAEVSELSSNRAASSYSASGGMSGSISSATPSGSGLTGVKAQGWLNSAYIVWTGSSSSYTVTCDDEEVSSYLTRKIGDQWRCDVPGLAAGSHTLKVTSGSSYLTATVNVAGHDRSGFAFYGSTVPGAYNADGTLKDNAVVLYVNESTKDSVSLDVTTSAKGTTTTCTGLQNILNGFKKGYDDRPLCVRLIGKVTDFETMDGGDIMISGSSSSKLLSNGITIEGIGSDATAYGWGIRLKNAQYVEISNIGFMMVDSNEGDNVSLQQSNKNVWVHNCDMFYGEAGGDSDQKKGDGALDCKKSTYVTFSYNHFWDSGKCNLLGLSEGTTSDLYITYHHNWYDHSDSRHPRCRYYSAHVYNNYYDGNAKYGAGACLGSSVFMEANYFRNCKYPMMISMQGSDLYAGSTTKSNDNATFSKEAGGMIKAYNNTMTGTYYFIPYGGTYSGADTTSDFDAYVVSSKSTTVPSSVLSLSGSNKYNNFDTSSIMYSYTADSPEDAVTNVKKYAGRIEGGDFTYTFSDSADTSYDVDTTLKAKLESYTGATTAYNTDSSDSSDSSSSDSSSGGSSSGDSSSSDSSSGSSSDSSSGGSGSSDSSSSSGSTTTTTSTSKVAADSYSTGSITSDTVYGDFTILATSKKAVKISSASATYGSTSYKLAWDLQGGSDGVEPTYRAFKVSLAEGDVLTAVVNANSARTLQLSDGSSIVASADVGTSASQFTYTATAAGTYYLYSKSSSMRVFELAKTTTSSSGSSDSSSGDSGSSDSSSDSSDSGSSDSSSTSTTAAVFNADNLSHGTFSSNVTSGSFTVYATSAKTVSTPYSAATLNETTFTQTLALGGGGSYNTYRAVGFTADKGTTVTVYASGASGRYLALSTSDGVESKQEVSSSIAEYTFTTASSGTYNLMSTSSGINIYYISVGSTGSSSGDSSSDSSSGDSTSSDSSSGGSSSSDSSSSSSSLSISASKTQNGVGTRSRLSEITSVSQIKNVISVSTADQFISALDSVVNGGAIVLAKGTYSFSETITISSSNNGSSDAMKYVMAAPGTSADEVILDFSAQTLADANRGIQLFGDYWHFYGITVKGAGDNGMYVSGNNNIVENCIFVENRDSGLQIARESSSLSSMSDWPANNLILNCTSYDNADKTGENADGFACKLTAGNGNVFDGCISYSNSDDGWDLYAKEATGSIGVVTIKNCVAFNNGKLTTGSSYGNGDMNGFKLGGSNGKVPTAHVVYNCVSIANGHDGFTDNGNGGALSLTNCTSYDNAKVNFNFYRTNKGTFTGLVTGSPNNSDKYGTSSVSSTLSKTVYYTNSKYYWIDSATSVTNGQKNVGTQISAPEFKSTTLPTADSNVHKNLRNSDGTVKLGDTLAVSDSTYSGASFSTQAESILGVSLTTN